MAEFCECGSLMIGGRCSNKSCSLKTAGKPVAAGKSASKPRTAAKGADAGKPTVRAANPRRASKVITYNLYDMQKKEPES